MPSRTRYLNAYRKKHPKLRNQTRKANYTKSRPAVKKRRDWIHKEVIFLLSVTGFRPDRWIANELKRSVQAIQQKRYQLRKEENEKCL